MIDEEIEDEDLVQFKHMTDLAEQLTSYVIDYVEGSGDVTPEAALVSAEILCLAIRQLLVNELDYEPLELVGATATAAACHSEATKLLWKHREALIAYRLQLNAEKTQVNMPGGEA